jgi:hypothetical protein
MEFGSDSNPSRSIIVSADQLHPGDQIADTGAEVIEPGLIRRSTTPSGQVEIPIRDEFGARTITMDADWPVLVDRPNLRIPGLDG